MLYYTWPSTVGVYKLTGVAANTGTFSGTAVSTKSITTLTSGMKLRIKVVLEKEKVTVSQRQYNNSTGALGDEVVLFNELSIPAQPGGGNGFGPIVQYKSHGCASMTYFQYGDLSMTYAATAFDALKNVQYAQSADQKYFINLVGDSNDPNIPDEEKESQKYVDGINRMNENEIFYISNADDGNVLTESTSDPDGNKTHTGLGTDNGYIATDPSDYIQQIAEYIYNNYINETKFNQAPIESKIPLANFYIKRSEDDSQLMTVHLKHLGDNDIVGANIVDKSKTGSTALGAGDTLVSWTLNVYDPLGNVIKTETVDDPSKITDFQISKNCTQGRYTFELSVKDNNGQTSETFQTYLTVFLDDEEPEASAVNTTKNTAKVTLVDRGPGIDDDGITFLEDGRGSGVAAYWLTTDINSEPTDDDWEYLATPVHEYSFDVNIPDFAGPGNNLVVWYKDECGNIGKELAYKPIKVEVQDADGNPIDEYYIISDEPVVVLPDLDEIGIPPTVPNPNEDEDEDFIFSGWVIPEPDPDTDDKDITIGDVIPVDKDDDDPVIIIRPTYTGNYVNLTYDVNAAGAWINNEGQTTETYQVPENSDLESKINAQTHNAHRVGYNFVGWTLDAAGNTPITSKVLTEDTTVYAQWEIASYNFYYD
ncbi:MAG: InlB B-repeat-containing protein, partial [Eubacterium sp.]|nr:InlB B-repeat-containing protein [Eubacterium sp.]